MTQSYTFHTKPAREIENLESKIRYLEEANSKPNPRADLNKAELEKLRELRAGWIGEQDEIRRQQRDHALHMHRVQVGLAREAYVRFITLEQEIRAEENDRKVKK